VQSPAPWGEGVSDRQPFTESFGDGTERHKHATMDGQNELEASTEIQSEPNVALDDHVQAEEAKGKRKRAEHQSAEEGEDEGPIESVDSSSDESDTIVVAGRSVLPPRIRSGRGGKFPKRYVGRVKQQAPGDSKPPATSSGTGTTRAPTVLRRSKRNKAIDWHLPSL
jgi:hypothetical protein